MVFLGFMISILLYTIYESLTSEVLMEPTVRITVLITIIVVLGTGSLPPVQAVFDRIMFRRAWEYRQLVREAQEELFETRQQLRKA